MIVEAVCDAGQQVLQVSTPCIVAARQEHAAIGIRFSLAKTIRDVEIRLRLSDDAMIDFSSLRITRAPEQRGDHGGVISPVARQA